jgi:hypothetical protein
VDDETGWNDVLLDMWTDAVRDAVVARIERATVGRRGWLVRVFADPEHCRPEYTETVHALVLAAIRDETGADLDALGSQAAWESYEQVWAALEARWADGGTLGVVALGAEPAVARAIGTLPVEAAAHLAADVSGAVPDPLWLGGRLRIDREGLAAYQRLDGGRLPAAVAAALEAIARLTEPAPPGRAGPSDDA